jgi:hypothetical protein
MYGLRGWMLNKKRYDSAIDDASEINGLKILKILLNYVSAVLLLRSSP